MTGDFPSSGLGLWFCDTRTVSSSALLGRYRDLLDPVEIARLERFRFEKDRHSFLVSHALLRCVLSEATGTDAAALRFGAGAQGKPCLLNAPASAGLSFNLSHSGSHAVVAAWHGSGVVGVDIEYHRPERRFHQLAERHFSRAECGMLSAAPEESRMALFYDIWTLKEAYLKARGTGLQLPLADFGFSFAERVVCFDVSPALDENPQRWRFWCARFAGGFSVSVALEAEMLPEPGLSLLTPLAEVRPVVLEQVVARSR